MHARVRVLLPEPVSARSKPRNLDVYREHSHPPSRWSRDALYVPVLFVVFVLSLWHALRGV